VFVLDLLPLELAGARIKDDTFTLVRDYSALGYEVVRVPVLPPQERIEYLLENLSQRGLV
jgi:predicted ATPase